MGFGHRIYKNYDPRATIIKETADSVFQITGRNPLLDIALELEKIAGGRVLRLAQALPERRLLGLIYQALGLPTAMFPVMFAIPRTAGWLAQWLEGIQDPEQKIARPPGSTRAPLSATTSERRCATAATRAPGSWVRAARVAPQASRIVATRSSNASALVTKAAAVALGAAAREAVVVALSAITQGAWSSATSRRVAARPVEHRHRHPSARPRPRPSSPA